MWSFPIDSNATNFLMIIDIGQKVLKVELNFKKHDGDIIILEVPQEGKTYKKQIPKPPKITIVNKGTKNCIEMEIDP